MQQKKKINNSFDEPTKENHFEQQLILSMFPQQQFTIYDKNPVNQAIFDRYNKQGKLKLQSFVIQEQRQAKLSKEASNGQLNKYERIYRMKNLDTGEQIFIHNDVQEQELCKQLSLGRNQIQIFNSSWESFWKNIEINNDLLMKYCYEGRYESIKALIQSGINDYPVQINCKNIEEQTPLHIAASCGYHQIVDLLCMNQANVKACNKFQKNGLHIACLKGHIQVVKVLILNNINVDEVDNDGNTGLHFAVQTKNKQILRLLLQSHAKLISNNKHLKPIDICQDQQIKEIFRQFGYLSQSVLAENINVNKRLENVNIQSFVFHKIIGKGAFGEVYAATEKGDQTGRVLAIKVLRKDKLQFKNLKKFAIAQKNIMSSINHPFVVKLHYAFQSQTKLFLAMDFYPGGTLGDLIKRYQKISQQQAKLYICELILALQTLHKKQIIYRDLKPDNVMLDEDGHCRLTDFGLSKQGVYDNLTSTFCGSIAYLAPEILLNLGHSRMIDWYLLGVLLYELLVGIPPYYNSIKQVLYQNIKKGPLKMPKAISAQVKDLIKRLLSRDSKKRLGFQRDAQQIKQHAFFSQVNWQQIYSKSKQIPLQQKQTINLSNSLNLSSQYQNYDNCEHIEGWQFINQEP